MNLLQFRDSWGRTSADAYWHISFDVNETKLLDANGVADPQFLTVNAHELVMLKYQGQVLFYASATLQRLLICTLLLHSK